MKLLHIPTGGVFADGIFSCILAYAQAMEIGRASCRERV